LKQSHGKITTFHLSSGQVKRIDVLEGTATINRSGFLRDAATYALYKILIEEKTDYLSDIGMHSTEDTYSVTIYLTNTQIKAIKGLVQLGISQNRSEFLRDAVVRFLQQTERFVSVVNSMDKGQFKPKLIPRGKTIDMRRVRWPKEQQ
jgi:Arc/MetJ-type ribon-helix-helix transcriptional regulator